MEIVKCKCKDWWNTSKHCERRKGKGEEKLRPYPASSGILSVLSDYIAIVDPAVFDSLHVMSVPTNSPETVISLEGIAQITAYPGWKLQTNSSILADKL